MHTLANIITANDADTTALYALPVGQDCTSYETYFNALHASFWRNQTSIRTVALQVQIEGTAEIRVLSRDANGKVSELARAEVSDSTSLIGDLSISDYLTGGYIWFEFFAKSDAAALKAASWVTETAAPKRQKLSIGITTMNKVSYCVDNLRQLASDENLLATIDRIMVIDQGSDKLAGHNEFQELAAKFGEQLMLIEQDNLGGSGGFSRAMYESLRLADTGYLLLLDDDVKIQNESILRAVTFANYCNELTIIGGHMFDLNFPNVLHAYSEIIEPEEFFWSQRKPEHLRHNFKKKPLSKSPDLHEYLVSDYNGWWMCLIPTQIIREIGLSMPYFLKWDDAEYGLRAKRAGYQTISLPGVALWHVSWLDKDDAQDWQAYFHVRNRLITALIYSDQSGGTLLGISAKHNLKQLLAMQYYSVTLKNEAMLDVLLGPEELHNSLRTALPAARDLAKGYYETKVIPVSEKPEATGGTLKFTDFNAGRPTGLKLMLWLAKNYPRHQFTKPRKNTQPEVEFPKLQGTWWRVSKYDSYLVENAAKNGYYWFKRDWKKFHSGLKKSAVLHSKVRSQWNSLQAKYRKAQAELVSVETWARTFGIESDAR